jgi:hypothetical protein
MIQLKQIKVEPGCDEANPRMVSLNSRISLRCIQAASFPM